jgi:hypothetical protein
MSLNFTPHWAFPTLFVLAAGLLATVFTSGCAVDLGGVDDDRTAAPQACGGAICFDPTDVAVKHWGDGDVTVVAWRADDLGCVVPHGPQTSADGVTTTKSVDIVPGTAIELRLHDAKPGARLPVYTHESVEDRVTDGPWATARAIRIGKSDGRALADEETVNGIATILDIDETTGRVRVRLAAKWSSGVTGEMLLDVDGPHVCTAGIAR